MDNTTKNMLSQLHKEVINGIVANSFDFGDVPTIETVKANWQYQYFNIANDDTINDDIINNIINLVSRYYNKFN